MGVKGLVVVAWFLAMSGVATAQTADATSGGQWINPSASTVNVTAQVTAFCTTSPTNVATTACSEPCGGGTYLVSWYDGCGGLSTWVGSCNPQACGN